MTNVENTPRGFANPFLASDRHVFEYATTLELAVSQLLHSRTC
jgi:hypothetical protein